MITGCKIKNFKSIRDEEDLEIRPLTIFTGANSSGKSTFIQSILLVAQTIIHKQIALQSVVLNGNFMSFGQFDDILHNGSELEDITVKCTCKPLEDQMGGRTRRQYYGRNYTRFDEISCDISFASSASHLSGELAQIRPQINSNRLSCSYTKISEQPRLPGMKNEFLSYSDDADEAKYHEAYISIKNPAKPTSKKSKELKSRYPNVLVCDIELDKDSLDEVWSHHSTAAPVGCMIRHFIPEMILCDINQVEESIECIFENICRPLPKYIVEYDFDDYYDEILNALRSLLKETSVDIDEIFEDRDDFDDIPVDDRVAIHQELSSIDDDIIYEAIKYEISNSLGGKLDNVSNVPISMPDTLSLASGYIDSFFSLSFKYLGPLRDAPRSLYPLSPATAPTDVGLRGEHTAAAIDLCKDHIVQYIPSKSFKDDEVKVNIASTTLEDALSDWLQYLEIAKSVESKHRGKQGHAMKVGISDPDNMHDLTHVGVGVSQVLPILVMGLLASPDTTLVFEQPELHLHPNVQFLLGDFFLSMALCKKQCIVESHSEHLVDQIRYRIASSSPDSGLEKLTKVYFAKKTNGVSSFEDIQIDEYGKIVNWPKGFFDQSFKVASKIMKSVAKKQKRSRRNKNANSS